MRRSVITSVLFVVIFCAGTMLAHAQWLSYPAAGTPRTADGKPNLTAKAPRVHGKPDLSGVWMTEGPKEGEIEGIFGADLTRLGVPGDDPRVFNKYGWSV